MKKIFSLVMIMALTSFSAISSETNSIQSFNSGDTISSSQMNSNFQFLTKQFKTNEKVINCPEDSITDAIDEGFNHLIINGTCQTTFMISPFHLPWVAQYGLEVIKPIVHLTLEGGTNGVLEKTNKAYEFTLRERLRSADAPIVNIGQRAHEDDVAGRFFIPNDDVFLIVFLLYL